MTRRARPARARRCARRAGSRRSVLARFCKAATAFRRLGAGGISTVYKALTRFAECRARSAPSRRCSTAAATRPLRQQRVANFEREAGLLAVLSHPLIPKIFDYFAEGGSYYLVQEFIPGQNLETLIERPPTASWSRS